MSLNLKLPLFVAMDMDTPEDVVKLASLLEGRVGGFKLGPRLILPYGKKLITELSRLAPVFVDCKFYDIPSTTEASVRAAFEMGASYVTVHASNGRRSLEQLARLEKELSAQRPFKILAVTILTSFAAEELSEIGLNNNVSQQVMNLTKLTQDCGLSGVVCSPQELKTLKPKFPDMDFVIPGIRFETDSKDDQSRTMAPAEALKAGASALVVGRPIIQAADPALAAEKILSTLGI